MAEDYGLVASIIDALVKSPKSAEESEHIHFFAGHWYYYIAEPVLNTISDELGLDCEQFEVPEYVRLLPNGEWQLLNEIEASALLAKIEIQELGDLLKARGVELPEVATAENLRLLIYEN